MVTKIRETERKYDAAEDGELPSFADLAGVAEQRDAEPVTLEATYYDTTDLRLLRERITLRRRTGGSDEGWHLKLPVAGDDRDEVHAPLGDSDTPPAELLRLVAVRTRQQPVLPVARLTTRRRATLLFGRDGDPVAEVVDDRVSAVDLGAPSPAEQIAGEVVQAVAAVPDGPQETVRVEVTADSTMDSWREVEVELTEHADAKLFERIEGRLGEVGVRRSASPSKLRRALAGRVPPAAAVPRIGKKPTALAVLIEYLYRQVERLKEYDALARQDAPDAVHQLRVSCRRVRSALRTFGTVLDRERTEGLVEELRWLAGELAGARDNEVFHELLRAEVARLPEELVVGPVAARLTKHFSRGAEEAGQVTLSTLDSERYYALLDALDELITDPPTAEKAGEQANKVLPAAVGKTFRKVRDRLADVAATEAEDRTVALHEVRKAAKKLRYATAVVQPVVGTPAREYRKKVKELQEALGDHHDAMAARPVVRDLGMQAHLQGENGFTFGLLHERLGRIGAELEVEIARLWEQLADRRARSWMR